MGRFSWAARIVLGDCGTSPRLCGVRARDKAFHYRYKNRHLILKEDRSVFALIALLGTVVIVTLLNAIEFGRGD